jgi:SAM-dependent methyltransferase
VVDAQFEEARLAGLYDPLDPDRSDLDVYAAMAVEFGAGSVLDVGCGTGTLACLLARRGCTVTGIDPAEASLAVARGKPGADRVRWLHGAAASLPPLRVDLTVMTGNVAQVFVTGAEWAAALRAVRAALRPGGRLVFESRDPARKAWLEWTREHTHRRVDVPGAGPVETWTELTGTGDGLVSFRTSYVFGRDGTTMSSDSTLRFRGREELAATVTAAGLVVDEVRDAPDRPGREFVFVTRRLDPGFQPDG